MRKVAIAALTGLALMAGQAVAADATTARGVGDRVGTVKGGSNAAPAVVRTLNRANANGGAVARGTKPWCPVDAKCVRPRSRGPR